MQSRNEQARAFLENLLGPIPNDSCVEIRTSPAKGKAVSRFFENVGQINVESYGFDRVWFGVAMRAKGATSGSLDNLTWATVIWADFDEADKNAVVAKLARFEVPPSFVVDSGRGIHAYWKLDRLLDMRNDTQRTYIREVVHGLAKHLGADTKIHDPSRVMGVPFTFNSKYTPSPERKVLVNHSSNIYGVDTFTRYRVPVAVTTPTKTIAPLAASPIDLGALKLSAVIMDLIQNGKPRGSRSEADEKVITALVAAGATDEQVVGLFADPAYKIGEKYREEIARGYGDNYIGRSLQAARHFLKTMGPGAILHGFRQQNGTLEVLRGAAWITLFDHTFKAIAKLEGQETGYYVEIDTDPPTKLTLPHGAFVTNTEFKRVLKMPWLGNDLDVQRLMAYLESQSPPTRRAVMMVGLHGDTVIYPNAQLDKDALTDTFDYQYTGTLTQAMLEECEDWSALATSIFNLLPSFQSPAVIIPATGWMLATFLAPRIRRLSTDHAFPLLYAYGPYGSGKSLTLKILRSLTGMAAEPEEFRGLTRFAIMDMLTSSNTVPVFLDEHRPDNDQRKLYSIFRATYNEESGRRGRPDLTTRVYPYSAPLIVAGESPFRDPALNDRTVNTHWAVAGLNPATKAALEDLPRRQFAAGFYRHVLPKDVRAVWKEAESLMPREFSDRMSFSLRQKHAWTTVAFGLLLAEPFWTHEIVIGYISQLHVFAANALAEITPPASAVLRETLRIIAELMRMRRISEGQDFIIRKDELWIIPNLVLPAVEEYVHRYPSELPLSTEAIRGRMKENMGDVIPIVTQFMEPVWVGKRTVRGISLSLEQIEAQYNIPVDYWMQGVAHVSAP